MENGGATAAAKGGLSIQMDTSAGEVFAHSIAPPTESKGRPADRRVSFQGVAPKALCAGAEGSEARA